MGYASYPLEIILSRNECDKRNIHDSLKPFPAFLLDLDFLLDKNQSKLQESLWTIISTPKTHLKIKKSFLTSLNVTV